MTHRRPKKIGVVDSIPLNGSVFHLWQCADCGGYFAAAERLNEMWLVGLVAFEPMYGENRRLNRVRAKWADARARGEVCTCEFHKDWPTSELLHVRLAESADEGSPLDGRVEHDDIT